MRATSTQTPAPRPRPSRTSSTTPSTRSACVLATTEANTKANHGVDHGPPPPSRSPENRRRHPPLNLHPIPHLHRDAPDPEPLTPCTATDDDAGQLVLTWSAPAAPNATPTDYHVKLGQEHRGLSGRYNHRRQRPLDDGHLYVGGPRLRHRLQRQGQGALHRRREHRQPVERTLDRDHRPGQAAAAHDPQHDGSRRQSSQSSLSVLVGPLE